MEQYFKIGDEVIIVGAQKHPEHIGMEGEVISNIGYQDMYSLFGFIGKTSYLAYKVLIHGSVCPVANGAWTVKPHQMIKKRPPTIPFEEMMNNLMGKSLSQEELLKACDPKEIT